MTNQSCKVCGKRQYFDFHVCNEIWDRVIPKEYSKLAVCLPCFDDFARVFSVDYKNHLYPIMTFVGDKEIFTLHISDSKGPGWLCKWSEKVKGGTQ